MTTVGISPTFSISFRMLAFGFVLYSLYAFIVKTSSSSSFSFSVSLSTTNAINHNDAVTMARTKKKKTTTTTTPTTGIIPIPTPPQLRYQSTDFSALITFNMATFAKNGDPGCDVTNWNVHADYATGPTSDPATFFPTKLNVSQWFDSITALGANIATLTAKHGCGFLLWPTEVQLPLSSSTSTKGDDDGVPYGYNVMMAATKKKKTSNNINQTASRTGTTVASSSPPSYVYSFPRDVVQEFANAAIAAGVGYGYYYSIMKNFYLCRDIHGKNSCMETILEGQYNLTDTEYLTVATELARELWTRYGNFTEIWFDSNLLGLDGLADELQPRAAGTPANPRFWCGTESGYPSRDVGSGNIWNTGYSFQGDPTSPIWVDKFCDPQLFVQQSLWFWEPNKEVRTLEDMIPIYHDIVGRGMIMELAFSINRDGLVDESHAKVYKQLGDWVRSCYGHPLAFQSGIRGTEFRLTIPAGVVIDRIMLQEDIVSGQRIRNYTVEINSVSEIEIIVGGSVGRKRIHLLSVPYVSYDLPLEIKLHISNSIALPHLNQFAAFGPCPTTTQENAVITVE